MHEKIGAILEVSWGPAGASAMNARTDPHLIRAAEIVAELQALAGVERELRAELEALIAGGP